MIAADFVLVKGRGPWSRAIEWADRSPYSHVQSIIDSQSYLDPVWPLINRVYAELLSSNTHYYVHIDNLTLDERERVSRELQKYVGKHYSAIGFIWCGLCLFFPFLRKIKDPLDLIGPVCSSALAKAYFRAGLYDRLNLGDLLPQDVVPSDLVRAWVK